MRANRLAVEPDLESTLRVERAVSQHLARAESDLQDQLVQALQEREAYRTLALAAISLARERQVEVERVRERHHRLLDEYRAHRARAVRRKGDPS